jgi:hypothetical protein
MRTAIDPRRLLQAADALLEAMDPDGDGMVVVHAVVDGRPAPGSFTPGELVEAMAMLIRLGLAPGEDPD